MATVTVATMTSSRASSAGSRASRAPPNHSPRRVRRLRPRRTTRRRDGATQLSVIDPDSAGIVASIRVPAASTNAAMAATGDGRLIASGEDVLVAVDLTTGDLLWSREFATTQPSPCLWLAVAPSRSTVFCGTSGAGPRSARSTRTPDRSTAGSQLGAVGPLTVSRTATNSWRSAPGPRRSPDAPRRLWGDPRMIARGQVVAAAMTRRERRSSSQNTLPGRTDSEDLIQCSVSEPGTDAARLRVPGVGDFIDSVGTDGCTGSSTESKAPGISTRPPGRASRATPFIGS